MLKICARAEREDYVRTQLRFLLEPCRRRFTHLLMARLWAEGCNYPGLLARATFYRLLLTELRPSLAAADRRLTATGSKSPGGSVDHPAFSRAMSALAHRRRYRFPMAAAVAPVLERIIALWLLDPQDLRGPAARFDAFLAARVDAMIQANPRGNLARTDVDRIRRRLHIALVTALLRIVPHPEAFYSRFGSLPAAVAATAGDRDRLARLMTFLGQGTPYAGQVMSQSFWRTLQSLDRPPSENG